MKTGERGVFVMIENEITEFKREYTDNILKTVIAFANTSGGRILIGVDDNGEPIGVENIDDCYIALFTGNAIVCANY